MNPNLMKSFQFILSLLLILGLATTQVEASPKLIGYYTYRSATSGLKVSDIPGHLLTHVIYSFLSVSADGECRPSPDDPIDEYGNPTVLAQFRNLKSQFPKLTIMMAVGGWGLSGKFSEIASDDLRRRRFVKSCVGILRKYGFDGLDIDWEYPVTGGLPSDTKSPKDPENFVLLAMEFRKELNLIPGSKKVLSAAVAAYQEATHLDVAGMQRHVDWLGVMAYDYCGAVSKTTGHHAALAASRFDPEFPSKRNAKAAITQYLAEGANPHQLILGVPFYAHAWAEVPRNRDGLYQTFNGVPKTRLGEGALSYQEVLDGYFSGSAYHFDPDAKVPWLYNPNTRILVSYEDPTSLDFKAKYTLQAGLGGIMIWELDHDGKQHELLRALFDAFNLKER